MPCPLRLPPFAVECKRYDISRVKQVAVFRFLSDDRPPWMALPRLRERWPELAFKLIPPTSQFGLSLAAAPPRCASVSPW